MLLTVLLVMSAIIIHGKTGDCDDSLKETRPCITPNGTQGYCTLSKFCPYINTLIDAATTNEQEFIKKSICGYDQNNSKLFCCEASPKNHDNFSSSQSINQDAEQGTSQLPEPAYCRTPNGDRARCISIFKCPRLLPIHKNITLEQTQFLRESKCGFENKTVLVCCGRDANFRNVDQVVKYWDFTYSDLIPSKNNCGLETFDVNNRIFGGDDSNINEFPWVALLEYETNQSNPTFGCGGSLISSRYVLTAAHCIVDYLKPINVRLGERDYNIEDRNCVQTNNSQICKEASIIIGIESLHPHPDYDKTLKMKYNDIGLIRLQRNIKFKNNVYPICLPYTNKYLMPGERMVISGWGLKNFNEETSVKQKLEVPVISRSQCSVMFERFTNLTIGSGQFCAGGEAGKDSCVGDSGGPIMKFVNQTSDSPSQWHIEGIVSFGHGCGVENNYGVYTRVSKYIKWIHETIVA